MQRHSSSSICFHWADFCKLHSCWAFQCSTVESTALWKKRLRVSWQPLLTCWKQSGPVNLPALIYKPNRWNKSFQEGRNRRRGGGGGGGVRLQWHCSCKCSDTDLIQFYIFHWSGNRNVLNMRHDHYSGRRLKWRVCRIMYFTIKPFFVVIIAILRLDVLMLYVIQQAWPKVNVTFLPAQQWRRSWAHLFSLYEQK